MIIIIIIVIIIITIIIIMCTASLSLCRTASIHIFNRVMLMIERILKTIKSIKSANYHFNKFLSASHGLTIE